MVKISKEKDAVGPIKQTLETAYYNRDMSYWGINNRDMS